MSVFGKQGQYASSCEPFSEWCESQQPTGTSQQTSSNVGDASVRMEVMAWDLMLTATKAGKLAAATAQLEVLRLLEADKGVGSAGLNQ